MIFRFAEFALDTDRRELKRGPELIAIEPQVFDLLVYLIANRDRVVSKDDLIEGVWGGRIVSESTLASRINAARRALGDSGTEQRLIRTVARKGLRFVAELQAGAAAAAPSAPPPTAELRQEVQFCTASDGVRIAYATVGDGLPLVKCANWLNHLEYDWQSPVWRPLFATLAARYRLIRYDQRGNGLSDWEVDDISLEAFVRDLETVADANALERFALLGMSQGCAVAIDYAVRHPHRVSHLILQGGYARGRRRRGQKEAAEQADALQTLMLHGWGQDNPAFRQIFTSLFIPGGTAEQVQWYNDLQRMTTSPKNATRIRYVVDNIDVSGLLSKVQAPTLVLHCRDDAVQPFDEGRRIAAGIPGARFVALDGRNHVVLENEPAWPRLIDEIAHFLAR